MISGAEFEKYTVEITRYEPVDPLALIEDFIPTGYDFEGFGGISDLNFDWNCPNSNSDLAIKMYVTPKQNGKSLVSYVYSNYELISAYYDTTSSNVTDIIDYESGYYKSEFVFVNWEVGNLLTPLQGNCYIKANMAKIDGKLIPTIQTTSFGQVVIDLGLDDSNIYQYNITISDGASYIQSIASNTTTLNLETNVMYIIKGEVIYNTSNGLCAKTVNYSFVNTYYENIANLTEDNVQIVSYQNGFLVGTLEYVNSKPEGYEFSALGIFDEAGNQIDIQEYNGEASLTFYNVVEGNYRIDAYYSKVESQNITLLGYNTFGPDDYYGLHIVGFLVWFSV